MYAVATTTAMSASSPMMPASSASCRKPLCACCVNTRKLAAVLAVQQPEAVRPGARQHVVLKDVPADAPCVLPRRQRAAEEPARPRRCERARNASTPNTASAIAPPIAAIAVGLMPRGSTSVQRSPAPIRSRSSIASVSQAPASVRTIATPAPAQAPRDSVRNSAIAPTSSAAKPASALPSRFRAICREQRRTA